MNRLFPIILLALLTGLGAGCARNYVITLTNGRTLTTASKPKLEGGMFVWKDAAGTKNYTSQNRVREISPASTYRDEQEKKAKFKP